MAGTLIVGIYEIKGMIVTIWQELDQLKSRGSQASKAGSLAGLHQKRKETLSQFFTPAWLVSFLWKTIEPAFLSTEKYSLLDNSIGAASMFRMASPERFSLHGLDVDGVAIEKVASTLDDAGFSLDIVCAGMEQVELGRYSAALINPPFSISLSSPLLTPYAGVTHYGKHGPNSSALTQEYALAQALAHCDIVAAVVPSSTTARLTEMDGAMERLRAVYRLPADTFRAENVQSVQTDLLIFASHLKGSALQLPEAERIQRRAINEQSTPEALFRLSCRDATEMRSKPIQVLGVDEDKPVVTLPATDDKRVILTRAGRHIKMTFFDGATEARVKNALFQKRLFSTKEHRYPAGTRYAGQFKLNIDVLVMQEKPFAALEQVVSIIQAAGGITEVTRDLRCGLAGAIKKHRKMTVPYGRTVFRKGTPSFSAVARKMALLNRHQKGAVVAPGDKVTATRCEAGFLVDTPRGLFDCEHDLFFATFEVSEEVKEAGYWEEVSPPIKASFPESIAQLEHKAKALGLDKWLSWDFQLEDLLELAFRPHGGICGWQMALGKTRLALALATLLNGPSLIVVKSRLIDELEREIRSLGLDDTQFQVIRLASDTNQLKKINIVSYERIKSQIDPRFPRLTIAKRLSGRVSNVIADEGGLLANTDSLQSRALWQIGAKKQFIFDGTPFPNYPREGLSLVAWAIGEERSYQPYSLKGGYLKANLFNSAKGQPTGRQAFLDHFICFEWATNEFLDSGHGAKREVPKIKHENLGLFRDWLAPFIKRRVQQEPAVSRHVAFPVPTLLPPTSIDWAFEHLYLYVQAVEDFASWYREQQEDKKGLSLTVILARLEACFKAANTPSQVSGFARPYSALTTKEIACINLVKAEVEKGRRPVVFARNPVVLQRLSRELDKLDISNLVFTGQETITKRLQRLNSGIREGDVQVLLASLGVTQDGLNLPQLNTFIFYNRSYKAREEFQAIYRLIRPQQKSDVYGYFLEMAGSIDEYMGQLIHWKSMASEAGLDYGEQPKDEEFMHFDAFIQQFLESLPLLKEKLTQARQRRVA